MESKVTNASILITGANGGIGLETVQLLMKENANRIVMACRTEKKALAAKSQLLAQDLSPTLLEAYGGFDMNQAESIQQAVMDLPAGKPFEIVFLQAGGMVVGDDFQFITMKGEPIEKTIFQNVLGGFLLLKFLEARNLLHPNCRIVFAGGEGARGIPGMIESPDFQSPEALRSYILKGEPSYNALNAIGVSKFVSALLVQQLAMGNDGREYIWFSPGLTGGTNGLDKVGNPKRFIMKNIVFPFLQLIGMAQGPKQAAQKYVDCLAGKYGKNGDLIGAPEGKALGKLVDQKPMNPGLTNPQFQEVFWEIASRVASPIVKSEPVI